MADLQFKTLSKTTSKSITMLLGGVDEGKTTAGISVSEQFDPTFKKSVVIDDTMFITNERDLFEGARQKGIDIPYWLDLTEAPGEKEFDGQLDKAVAMAKELAKSGKIKNVVVDTISAIDKTWKSHKTRAFEGFALHAECLRLHRRFLMEQLFTVPARIILISQIQSVSAALSKDGAKLEASGLSADEKFVMNISTWEAPKLYREQCSYIIPVRRTYNTGKPDEFFLYPRGSNGIESKCKSDRVDAKEPAHLAAFFRKISNTANSAA